MRTVLDEVIGEAKVSAESFIEASPKDPGGIMGMATLRNFIINLEGATGAVVTEEVLEKRRRYAIRVAAAALRIAAQAEMMRAK